jgi:acyl carrier protein
VDDLELDLKRLIVDTLNLEGMAPEEIGSDEPLFVEGLGLDSIDALELGVALRKAYGLKIEAVTDDVRRHFVNVRSLAKFVRSQQGGGEHAVA